MVFEIAEQVGTTVVAHGIYSQGIDSARADAKAAESDDMKLTKGGDVMRIGVKSDLP